MCSRATLLHRAKNTPKIQQDFVLLDVYKFYKGMVLEQTDWEDTVPPGRLRVIFTFQDSWQRGENRLDSVCMLHKAIFTYLGGGE